VTVLPFAWPGFRGEAAARLAGEDLPAAARLLLDPAVATATLHWGRNYIYRANLPTAGGDLAVAVKQFRERSLRARWLRARGRSKAAKSFRMATAFAAAGLSTPEPLFFAEAEAGEPTAIFVTACLDGRVELRYLLRARNAGTERESFPGMEASAAIAAVAAYARRMHDAGFFHRDFSIGNLLLQEGAAPGEIADVAVLDLNRCRRQRAVSTTDRMRDLCRLPLERAADRELLLDAYFAPGAVPDAARQSYDLGRRGFLAKNRLKARLRGGLAKVRSWLVPRGVHAHIPPPPKEAEIRDRAVWDRLSDQPHQHAGRWARARIRVADLPKHLRAAAALAGALPRIRGRYRQLAAAPVTPFAWPEPGIALRPWPENPAALLAAFDRLGARRATIRLHPWQKSHDEEPELARALADRGVDLAFTLPQNRELVRDPARWERAEGELARRFRPLGKRFQVGQAINRSKWGIWNYDEYLARGALPASCVPAPRVRGRALRAGSHRFRSPRHGGGGEPSGAGRASGAHLDGCESFHVDRARAENRQLGFDTVDKVTLAAAIAERGRLVGRRASWVTEVNWPLREGPHSPAGKSVAVDEQAQADFLVRFYLLAAGSGLVERIDWWQLVAKGYGLCDPEASGTLRERPSFRAMATLIRELAGTTCHGALPAAGLPPGARAMRFTRGSGSAGEILVAWSTGGALDWTPASSAGAAGALQRIVDRDGGELPLAPDSSRLLPAPRYFFFLPR
jgi:hypothetical protein